MSYFRIVFHHIASDISIKLQFLYKSLFKRLNELTLPSQTRMCSWSIKPTGQGYITPMKQGAHLYNKNKNKISVQRKMVSLCKLVVEK